MDVRTEATRSVHAFDALLAEYRALAPTERDKGNYFEGVIAQYLRHDSQMRTQYLTLHGIPEAAQDYQVNSRSPLDWVIDRYKVTVHKKSGIRNDPNDYCREVGKPDYIVDLIKRLVTVSVETQRVVALLPGLEITDK